MEARRKDLNSLRILAQPGMEEAMRAQIERVALPVGFDYPATLRGSTANFNVYYDATTRGDTGAASADGVLAACENDYNVISVYFGGLVPPGLTFNDATNSVRKCY